jgi:hypothetical protein
MKYQVKWDMEIEADSPEEAAIKAHQMMKEPRVFIVEERYGLMAHVVEVTPQYVAKVVYP